MTLAAGIPSPPSSSFQLGPLTVHFYAICILIGMVIAVLVTNRRLVRRGVASGKVLDIALWAVPIALVGGRLYHVVTHPTDYFSAGDNPWNIPAVWEGGLAIFGSILFGTVGAYIGCRRAHVRFLTFADALAPGMLLAQAFGRLGNYFNQELYGSPTTLPWGLQITYNSPAYPPNVPPGTLFQPLFLYEMIWNIGVRSCSSSSSSADSHSAGGRRSGSTSSGTASPARSSNPCATTRRSSTSPGSRSTRTSPSSPRSSA